MTELEMHRVRMATSITETMARNSVGGREGRGGRSHGAVGGRGCGRTSHAAEGGRGLGGGRQGGGRRLPLQVTTNAATANTATNNTAATNTATSNAATAKRVMRCSRCLELGHTSRSLVCKAKLMEKIERERQERELGGRNQEATAAREPELVVLDDDEGEQPSSLVTQDQGEEDIGIDEALLALETMGD